MNALTDKRRVNGFLTVKDGKLFNGSGEEIILSGVALGNWLLQEGYMWQFGPGADRSLTIKSLIRRLAGSDFAREFWPEFFKSYISDRDFELIAGLGFNSVRIPINWRVVMKDEPGIEFIEDGMAHVKRAVDSCRKYGLYAILDLHGAPGGQTGSNIDDSADDIPRLFIDPESREKCIALWEELARRYKDDAAVAAYDLLNEPLRTPRPGKPDTEHLHPELARFYDDCISAIRKHDSVHAISLEGANWATRLDTFFKSYDPRMILHFHRYGCIPGEESLAPYIDAARRIGAPCWIGESGENENEWYAAMFPLSVRMGCGFNFWTWKKLSRADTSIMTIRKPAGWDKLEKSFKGGPIPTYAEAQRMFSEYIENSKAENCQFNQSVADSIFRRGSFTVMATDFDGTNGSFHTDAPCGNVYNYRLSTGMRITLFRELDCEPAEKKLAFDCGWKKLCLELHPGEWVKYSVNDARGRVKATVSGISEADASQLVLSGPSGAGVSRTVGRGDFRTNALLDANGDAQVTLKCVSGSIKAHTISFDPA